jgi:uncharacterized protein YggU (UPF0235/DUF167 family)
MRPDDRAGGCWHARLVRVSIRVRPGAGRAQVGGRYADALVVRVRERAVDGRATDAALRALADALVVRAADVTLVTGRTSRTKVVEIPDDSAAAFQRLLDDG